jgi:uncharacterized protein (DUF1330 family)
LQTLNAVNPTPAQIQALTGSSVEGPIVMLNLLKFREKAAYEDGRDAHLSGLEAYLRYGAEMQKLVAAGGGRIVFNARAKALVIGDVEDPWDAVALVEYPSPQAFVQIVMSEQVAKIAHHRKAGLAGQLLIMCASTPPTPRTAGV